MTGQAGAYSSLSLSFSLSHLHLSFSKNLYKFQAMEDKPYTLNWLSKPFPVELFKWHCILPIQRLANKVIQEIFGIIVKIM